LTASPNDPRGHLHLVADEVPEDDSWRDAPDGEPDDDGSGTRIRLSPEIQCGPDVHRMIDECLGHLAEDPLLFRRANELVTVVGACEPADGARSPIAKGTPIIRPLVAPAFVPRITRRVQFVSFRAATKEVLAKWVPCQPPPAVTHGMLAIGDWPTIRPLIGVAETPVFRPDGSLAQTPGYDERTGYLYAPSARYPAIADQPTQDDARRALGDLQHVFADFPYVDRAHAMVPVAAILTVLARTAIDGAVPAFLFDASTRGSGKTLQADVVSLVAVGRSAARKTFPKEDDELEKILSSYAIAGARLILLDNITRELGGGPLDAVLTARDDVELRVLGRSEMRRLPWAAVIMASGNNVIPTEDTARRLMIARLESPLETPEERTDFLHEDLGAWVRAERPRLVAAALTILRAYAVKGFPDAKLPRWGSFEAWSRLIPGALVFAGGEDPMLARPRGDGAISDEQAALVVVLRELPRLLADPQSVKGILDTVYPAPRHDEPPDGWDELREALEVMAPPHGGQIPAAKVLGRRLGKYVGRVLNGRRLRVDISRGVRKWSVETL
jgi:hypothetical protein